MLFAWLTFLLSLVITILFYRFLKQDSVLTAENYFNVRVDEINTLIQQRMKSYEQVLQGGAGLFYASDQVSREEWRTYVGKLDVEKHYPGILGIGFSQVLKPEQVKEHIIKVRAEGFPEYKIWPEYERDIYTTILFLEPFSGRNLRAFGYDMFTDATRHAAMSSAMDSAITALSGKVILVQETSTEIQPGFLIYLPVYDKKKPVNTVEQRRAAIRGFVYGPFRIEDLMHGILGKTLPNIRLQIYDDSDTNESSLMYNSNPDADLVESRFTTVSRVNIDNHYWTLKFETLPSFEFLIDRQKPTIVLLTGIIISILFFIVVVSYVRTNEIKTDLELILASSGEGIYGLDIDGKCIFINNAATKILDLTADQCNGKLMHDLIHHHHPDNRAYPFNECPIHSSLENGIAFQSDTEVFFRSDGTSFQVSYSFNPIVQDNRVTGGVVTFSDITEKVKIQKALRLSEEKFRLAVDNFPYTLIIYDNERRITFINSIGRRSFFLTTDKIIGKKDEEIFPSEITYPYLPSLIEAFEKKIPRTIESTINLSGNKFSFISNFVPLLNDQGEIDQMLGITQDITELKKAQEKIINSLNEKDVLLKEIHHRVKNNLQIISSLLNLQTNKIQDQSVIDIIKESQNRVRSMALVHERLYQTDNMSQIDFSEYIPELLNYLISSYYDREKPVRLELNIQKTEFNIDISISLALIINELVSNSLKHAFNGQKGNNKIIVSLIQKDKYELTISDNGTGFPEALDFRQSDSLGLQLVNSLVEQVNGKIELEKDHGTTFTIRFPV